MLAVSLALDAELARALVLGEHADILRLREQIEQRIDELLQQGLGAVGCGRRVQDVDQRVELALDQPDRLLVRHAHHAGAHHRQPPHAPESSRGWINDCDAMLTIVTG